MKDPVDWEEADALALIRDEVQESLTLDYKQSDALGKSDGKKSELSKDVSAFANSSGGTILYGMAESRNYPTQVDDGLDPSDISKEWIEQVVNSSVHPKIEGLRINQIPLRSRGTGRVVYAICIPAATSRAPHQAKDKRYYKRYNFGSVPMEDYEVLAVRWAHAWRIGSRRLIPTTRVIAGVELTLTAVAITIYLVLVVAGYISKENRLSVAELGLALAGCLFLVLAVYPEAFDRLSLLKLPGGIEVTLEKIQRQQVEQRRELDGFFSILSNMLSLPEKYHLRSLARTDDEYKGRSSLREELFRLKRFGLIDEIGGQKIGDMFDGKKFKLRSFVSLTSQGGRFIRALDDIERS